MNTSGAAELQGIYKARFARNEAYRRKVWNTLVSDFFQKYVAANDAVLDLGCGYGEFINAIRCERKFAMDLNPDVRKYLASEVQLMEQDCSMRWALPDISLDVVFTSNFFEHLASKVALAATLDEIFRCLAPGGKLIAMGPNIKYLAGQYWDFWDHYLPLSDLSLCEGLNNRGFEIVESMDKFLPYTTAKGHVFPELFVKLYLRLPFAWRIFGKQFLIIAAKPRGESPTVALPI